MKAKFFDRLTAYIIDVIIISLITSIIFTSIPTNNKELEKQLSSLQDEVLSNNITYEEFVDEYQDLYYKNKKDTMTQSAITLTITIAYFVIFQYMNKGQTIGKKILHLRVVDNNTEKPLSIFKGLIRSLLIWNILSGTLGIVLIYILNKESYITSYLIISSIESIFIFITAMFTLYRKDNRGLHDIIINSKVIIEGK
ncbi:MAG: RDD family protein [Bacilli bacterium]|nr:RDD family protein [bacterium]MDY3934817.1 RDD family protein [Bacilli bacterium]